MRLNELNPTVFISYTHDNEKHIKWVEKLAYDLTTPWNINVIIDQWNARIGGDLNYFMEQSIYKSRVILCICSDNYVDKVNSRAGGAGYEGNLISSKVMTGITNENIIPIIRNNELDKKMPHFFGNREYIDLSKDEVYTKELTRLVERLWDHDKSKVPVVAGGNPFKKDIAHKLKIETMMLNVKYRSIEMDSTINFNINKNNGIYNIGKGEFEFSLNWSSCGRSAVYCYSDPSNIESIAHSSSLDDFPTLKQITEHFETVKRTVRAKVGDFILYTNQYSNISVVKLLTISQSEESSRYENITFQYKIYN